MINQSFECRLEHGSVRVALWRTQGLNISIIEISIIFRGDPMQGYPACRCHAFHKRIERKAKAEAEAIFDEVITACREYETAIGVWAHIDEENW